MNDTLEKIKQTLAMGLGNNVPPPMEYQVASSVPVAPPSAPSNPIPRAKVAPIVADEPPVIEDVPQEATTPGFDISKYLTSPEELQEIRSKQKGLGMMGGIFNSLANTGPSFGEFYLGKFDPTKRDVAGQYSKLSEMVEKPMEDKQKMLKQLQEKPGQEFALNLSDPKSMQSKFVKSSLLGQLGMLKQSDVAKNSPDLMERINEIESQLPNLSGFEANKMAKDSGLEGLLKEGQAWQKMKNALDVAEKKASFVGAGLGLKMDEQAAGAAGKIHENDLIKRTTRQLGQLDIDKHTIENSEIITPQILKEISMGIASALNGGGQVGLHASEMQDLSTSQTAIAAIQQKLTNKPQEGASPEIKKQVLDTLARLKEGYQVYQSAVANRLAKGRNYSSNPKAQQAIKEAVSEYTVSPHEAPKKSLPEVGTIRTDVKGRKWKHVGNDEYQEVK